MTLEQMVKEAVDLIGNISAHPDGDPQTILVALEEVQDAVTERIDWLEMLDDADDEEGDE